MTKSLFLLAGTYEELLLGYRLDLSDSGTVKLIFTDHSHSKSIRSVAISSSGRYFASGSSDETFQVFSHLFSRPRSVGSVQHETTVSSLRFSGDDRLISVDESGALSIWKAPNWESPMHSFPKTHKRCAPSDLAIHPSGRLALTIAEGDRTMRTWDLIHLRQAACVPCSKNNYELVSVFWSKSGQSYGILFTRELEIYSTSDCQKITAIKFDTSATCAAFVSESDFAVVGFQNGQISAFNLIKDKHWTILDASTENGRVKALASIDLTVDTGLISSGSSTGWIRVFRYSRSGKKLEVEQTAAVNVGARITCMAAAVQRSDIEDGAINGEKTEKNMKRKRTNPEGTADGEIGNGGKRKKRKLEINGEKEIGRKLTGRKIKKSERM